MEECIQSVGKLWFIKFAKIAERTNGEGKHGGYSELLAENARSPEKCAIATYYYNQVYHIQIAQFLHRIAAIWNTELPEDLRLNKALDVSSG